MSLTHWDLMPHDFVIIGNALCINTLTTDRWQTKVFSEHDYDGIRTHWRTSNIIHLIAVFTRVQFSPSGIVVACVCVRLCLSVCMSMTCLFTP